MQEYQKMMRIWQQLDEAERLNLYMDAPEWREIIMDQMALEEAEKQPCEAPRRTQGCCSWRSWTFWKTKYQDQKRSFFVRCVFLVGFVIDAVLAMEWAMVSLGLSDRPIRPCMFYGSGQDFRYAMGIGSLMMMSWSAALLWGSFKPIERRGLLVLVIAFLAAAMGKNLVAFSYLFSARQLVEGTTMMGGLVMFFGVGYLVASNANNSETVRR